MYVTVFKFPGSNFKLKLTAKKLKISANMTESLVDVLRQLEEPSWSVVLPDGKEVPVSNSHAVDKDKDENIGDEEDDGSQSAFVISGNATVLDAI